MVVRRMLFGGAAAITLGAGLACPARAADTPQAPGVPAVLSPAQPGQAPEPPAELSLAQPGQADGGSAALGAAQPGQDPGVPSLVIHKAHQDLAGHAVEYTLWVRNEGTAPTHGKYTVVENLPDGATATSVDGGPRWSCATDTARTIATCTSRDGLAPGTTSDPITVRAGITDEDPCQLVNVAAVSGGHDATDAGGDGDRGGVHLAKDVLTLPCHRQAQAAAISVNINVTGNNNGGRGGDSSGATANGNGHIHDIAGGIATARSKARAKAGAKAHATAVHRHRSHHHRGTCGCRRWHRRHVA